MYNIPVMYKYNSRVDGEVFEDFHVLPKVSINPQDEVVIFNTKNAKTISVQVESYSSDFTYSTDFIGLQIRRFWNRAEQSKGNDSWHGMNIEKRMWMVYGSVSLCKKSEKNKWAYVKKSSWSDFGLDGM